MAYRVFLVEPIDVDNWIELDTEYVDFTTIFSVADIADISTRKDKITKQIAFRGSQTNNEAFGNLFHLNRTSDFGVDNKLFFNYNPLRTVDALIYEDGVLLLKGSLRVLEINVDKNNTITYQTVITGSFIDFRDIVSERMLDELDFSDLKHRYTWSNIRESWDQRTERWVSGTTYNFQPFKKGEGYVYPYIDYGVIYKKLAANADINNVNIQNFRPAIFVKEYFNRIFKQPELKGYTYEIRGDQDTVDRFNSLIVPNNLEKLVSKSVGMRVDAFSTGNQINNISHQDYGQTGDVYNFARAIQLQSMNNTAGLFDWYGSILGQNGCSFIVKRTFITNGRAQVRINSLQNKHAAAVKVVFQLCEREFISDSDGEFDNHDEWKPVASSAPITVPLNGVLSNRLVEFEIGERTFEQNSLLMLRMFVEGPNSIFTEPVFGSRLFYSIGDAFFKFPKDANGLVTYDVQVGDVITPTPVEGIKQMDFMKSVMHLFNFYVFTTNDRPKHLIFHKYDDFYAMAQPPLLKDTAIDWSEKIDYTNGLKVMSNVKVPKKYLFTFKDDGDFLNKDYKTRYNEPYGTFRFNDSYGLGEEKKVEVVFSPSPLMTAVGTGRVYPGIFSVSSNQKAPFKSNIRILFYNGVKNSGNVWSVGKDDIINNTQDVTTLVGALTNYPQAGNYLLKPGLTTMEPIEDLYFGLAKFMYFDFTTLHQNVPTAYHLYYKGQVTSITNPNVVLIDCNAYLNEIDVANLDLRQPVFVDLGSLGHAYCKVLSVEYEHKNTTTRLALQKIDMK